MRTLLSAALLFVALLTNAAHLRIHGLVTDATTREPLGEVLVRVYKDGVKLESFTTGAGGHYSTVLENGGNYVIRFSLPGRVTKCFAVDTHGPSWEGDGSTTTVEVEMTLFEKVHGLDLSFFDMPMGLARFTPMTGYLAWDGEYEGRVRPEADRLFAEVLARRERLASLNP
ncbi:MAG: hypothetical protein IPL52_00345 [Flavobacteriales bacterium]|nr:hypothetical protein [Flavobacteriales bacterium]